MNLRKSFVQSAGKLALRDFEVRSHAVPRSGDRAAVRAMQLERFSAIYRHAFTHFPFYAEKYGKAGLSADSIKGFEDIALVPPLLKAELASITCGGLAGVSLSSGGTGGNSAKTYIGGNYLVTRYAMLLAILRRAGWEMGAPIAALHPVEYSYFDTFTGNLRKGEFAKLGFEFFQQYVLYLLFHNRRNLYYTPALFEGGEAQRLIAETAARKPVLLLSRPDAACSMLRQAKAEGWRVPHIPAAILVGNTLSDAGRQFAAEALQGMVLNMYASTEAGYVSLSCGQSSAVHVDEGNYLVETEAASSEILVTDFNNNSMPLIRYRTGDIGQFEHAPCPCGDTAPLLRAKGRIDRYVEIEGRRLYDTDITNHTDGIPQVTALRLSQAADGIVVACWRGSASEEVVLGCLKGAGIPADRIHLERDAQFERSSSGKFCVLAKR